MYRKVTRFMVKQLIQKGDIHMNINEILKELRHQKKTSYL